MDRELLIFVAGCCQILPAVLVWHWFKENKTSFGNGALGNLVIAHAVFLNLVIGFSLVLATKRYPQGYEMISTIAGFSAAALLGLSFGKFFTSRSMISIAGMVLAIIEITSLFLAGRA